ncbi:MAG: restriction endonuclease [Halanaeroarchaeum sp.]
MFEDMSDRDFVDFLAAVWEQRGWKTAVSEGEAAGQYMLTGDREDGERGLMLIVPDESATVAGKPVRKTAEICESKNVDLGVVATRGELTDEAREIADRNDIYLLDTGALEATVAEEGLQDVVEEYSNGSAGSILGTLAAPLGLLSALKRPSPFPIPTRALTVFLVVLGIAAVVIGGVQAMGMGVGFGGIIPDIGVLPGIGGGGSDGMTMTAVSLTGSADADLEIAWDATTRSTIVAANNTTYPAPEGEKFVVVEMRVTNDRPATSTVSLGAFGFATNGEIRGPHPLNGTDGPFPLTLDPNESETAWVVFTVDANADSGTLLALPTEGTPPIRFERDRSVDTGPGGGSSGFDILLIEPGRYPDISLASGLQRAPD